LVDDAGQPASQPNWRDTDNRKAEVQIALSIGGQGSIDFHCLLIYLGGDKVILESIEEKMADIALCLVRVCAHQDSTCYIRNEEMMVRKRRPQPWHETSEWRLVCSVQLPKLVPSPPIMRL